MRSRIFIKMMAAFFLVIFAGTLILDIAIRRAWEESLLSEIRTSLTHGARQFAQQLESGSKPVAEVAAAVGKAAEARATVIDRSGKVLADSEADPGQMENHAQRPEFVAALAGKAGSDVRLSATRGIEFMYVAVPYRDGAVRLAYPLEVVETTTARIRRRLLLNSLLAIAVAMLVAGIAAHSISRRLQRIVAFAERVASGELSARVSEGSSDEIAQVATALDATARKLEESFAEVDRSRQQLEAVLNSMEEAVIAVDADRGIRWVNGSMQRLLRAPVRVGVPLVEVARDPEFLRALDETIQKGSVHSTRAALVVPGRVFNVTAAPMPGGGAVAVLSDLTEIERVEKTRRDFIANVSHELRTPLTSIQGYTETLLDSAGNANDREFLEVIRKNATRMARLTEDLLTLARVESGEERFDFEAVVPVDLLNDAVESCQEVARSRQCTLTVESAAPTPVRADGEAIHQVLVNLITNAVKHGPSGNRVAVGAQVVAAGVEFYVRDSGPGIASEHLPRLFERFYRVDKSRSIESGGTGLGLAIAKHIVLQHGGNIRAESQLNHGSIFYFTVPRAE